MIHAESYRAAWLNMTKHVNMVEANPRMLFVRLFVVGVQVVGTHEREGASLRHPRCCSFTNAAYHAVTRIGTQVMRGNGWKYPILDVPSQ